MNWNTKLRRDLQTLAASYSERADTKGYPSNESVDHVLLFPPASNGLTHGNFIRESYAAIQSNPEWRARLSKAHSHKKGFPAEYREGAAELDSSMSSDALLMNCFCYPGFVNAKVATLLGVTPGAVPKFGEKARIKLSDGSEDHTELDMQLGHVNVEAKLTEGDFTEKSKARVEQYADFSKTFETSLLSSLGESYLHYQLIRNVLAVASSEAQRFVLVLDARRPDLLRSWWNVHTAIKDASLRARCRFVFWQELAEAAEPQLRSFLKEKYALCR